jgi:hypothetical protein
VAQTASPDMKQTTITVRPDQIVSIDRLKAVLQEQNPGRIVYRSDVVRIALDLGLPQLQATLDRGERVELDGIA